MITIDHILHARDAIGSTLDCTPMITDHTLSDHLGRKLLLKAELFQRTGSFKTRGALNWIRTASERDLGRGLGAVSAGNHALALPWAARATGTRVTVVMPENANRFKVEGARAMGAEVILEGDINAAWSLLYHLLAERELTLVHPYDDLRIIAGQGTVGLEIIRQAPDAALILCPIGGGGLISGIALAARALRPDLRIIGVEPEGAASMAYAWSHGRPARLPQVATCAWSLAAAEVGEHTYRICRDNVDDLVTVSEAGIQRAMRHLMINSKLAPEPGGAVGIAALLENRITDLPARGDVVVVIAGGNAGQEELASFL